MTAIRTIAYVSCPTIAAQHLRAWWLRHSQYYVQVPNQFSSEEQLENDDIIAEMEDEDARCCADNMCLICCQSTMDDEPACGDCGGCVQCMGEPEDEVQFDTLEERMDFYREIC